MKANSLPGKRNLPSLLLLVAAGLALYFFFPTPPGLDASAWATLLLFALTVAGVLWNPYPIGVVVLLSLSLGMALGILTLEQALRGFSNQVTWIIVAAFLFARAFVKTGLGRRIALSFIQRLGKSSLSLGYALALTDLVLAPVTASNTARAGGIIFPVARSLAHEFESKPGESARKIGSYLLFTSVQANIVTSALFLTAMAANGLSVHIARDTTGFEITWATWFQAASVPGLISLLLLPYLIYRIYPPRLTRTPEAIEYARRELGKLGPLSREEYVLFTVFVALAVTWATSGLHSISTINAAFAAIALLLLFGVLDWSDATREDSAWGTLIWFGGFVSLAGALNDSTLVSWFIEAVSPFFEGWAPMATLLILLVVYIYVHYGFASMTSQIIALLGAFLALAVSAGAPPMLTALLFCFFSNLYACLTHYGDGAAPIFYGSGYIDQRSWWRAGFVISLFHLAIWLGLGLPWWRFLGIW